MRFSMMAWLGLAWLGFDLNSGIPFQNMRPPGSDTLMSLELDSLVGTTP
jgi:hypothetical protein